jgi:N-acetylneuraminate 9-O-acetyltransferase
MDDSSVKAEDQTMLLEEGGQAMAAKPAYTSLTSQILRFSINYKFTISQYQYPKALCLWQKENVGFNRLIFMDQLLLLENHLTLRAM